MKKNIILFVPNVPSNFEESLKVYKKKFGQKLRVAVMRDPKTHPKKSKFSDIDIKCNMNSSDKIEKALLPYQDELLAITCRNETFIDAFSKVIPNVPYLKTPTSESLLWSVDKIQMRRRFRTYNKKITPQFMVVKDVDKKNIQKIKEKVGFPLIMKPASLATSLLVTICYHEEELEKNLKKAFRHIKKIYKAKGQVAEPKILVEQFMEGEMYSVDAYVTSRGKIYFCPFVHVKTGRSVGFDDFFGYMQMTPSTLKKNTINSAESVAKEAIHALGLRSTTAHVELMRTTDDGWKIVEVGPRIGGFRSALYEKSYGFDHGLNDILIRIPKKPILNKKVKGYSAAMKFFPKTEGILTQLKGIKRIENIKSVQSINVNKQIGDRCRWAKNGGASVCNLILFNKKRPDLLADIRRIENTLQIETKKPAAAKRKLEKKKQANKKSAKKKK